MTTHIRQQQKPALWIAALGIALIAFSATAQIGKSANHIITFDVPGAGTGPGQGTQPIGIVQGGWIMGSYIDAKNVYHGFLRSPLGFITKFDVPGMGTGPGQGVVEVFGMTPYLEIVGDYLDSSSNYHAFVRTPFGEIKQFSCPGAGSGGSAAQAINPAGVISAMYMDENAAWHGCLRARDGSITDYDPPDAGTGFWQGTYVALFAGITPAGAVIGEYVDNDNVWHAHLRSPDGAITEFNGPGAGTDPGQGSGSTGINPAGVINAWYIDANNVFHGFLRWPDGRMPYDVPGAGTGPCQGTNAACYTPGFGCIRPDGTITGVPPAIAWTVNSP